jgi:hypothetical protein
MPDSFRFLCGFDQPGPVEVPPRLQVLILSEATRMTVTVRMTSESYRTSLEDPFKPLLQRHFIGADSVGPAMQQPPE